MRWTVGAGVVLGSLLFLVSTAAVAQQRQPALGQRPQGAGAIVPPNQPRLQLRRPAQIPGAPFQLTPPQQAQVAAVLNAWEKKSSQVVRFETSFYRFEYDATFGQADKPLHMDLGEAKYAAPDRGMFRTVGEMVDWQWIEGRPSGGRLVEGQRAEQWVCDGKSIFAYDFQRKLVTQHKLPPELQGRSIVDGPLPFLFGAEAKKLQRRYWVRLVTPAPVQSSQVWIDAWPRFQTEAASFRNAQVILSLPQMQPLGIKIYQPGGRQATAYQFFNVKINDNNLLGFLKGDPFKGKVPRGWQKVVEEVATAQAGPQAAAPRRK